MLNQIDLNWLKYPDHEQEEHQSKLLMIYILMLYFQFYSKENFWKNIKLDELKYPTVIWRFCLRYSIATCREWHIKERNVVNVWDWISNSPCDKPDLI